MLSGLKGTWCSGITPAQHARGPGFNPERAPFEPLYLTIRLQPHLAPRCLNKQACCWPTRCEGSVQDWQLLCEAFQATWPCVSGWSNSPVCLEAKRARGVCLWPEPQPRFANMLEPRLCKMHSRARGVVVSHPLSMREALGSIPGVSIDACWTAEVKKAPYLQ